MLYLILFYIKSLDLGASDRLSISKAAAALLARRWHLKISHRYQPPYTSFIPPKAPHLAKYYPLSRPVMKTRPYAKDFLPFLPFSLSHNAAHRDVARVLYDISCTPNSFLHAIQEQSSFPRQESITCHGPLLYTCSSPRLSVASGHQSPETAAQKKKKTH